MSKELIFNEEGQRGRKWSKRSREERQRDTQEMNREEIDREEIMVKMRREIIGVLFKNVYAAFNE